MVRATILVGKDSNNVDFGSAIEMSKEEQDKFVNFIKTLFAVVEIDNESAPRQERLGDKNFMKEWTPAEYALLLENEETEKIGELLGRSWMSVDIKRGDFLQLWQEHLRVKDIDPTKGDLKQLIEEFLKSREVIKLGKRERKRELNRLQKELEKIPARFKEVEFLKSMGKATQQDINDFLAHEEEIKNRIAELEK